MTIHKKHNYDLPCRSRRSYWKETTFSAYDWGQTYLGDSKTYNVKDPPILIARTIEQLQRRLIRSGTLEDLNMCRLIQVVISNTAVDEDFDSAAANVRNFHIDQQMDFLRRPLLHLLIIDLYNKRGRCASRLRAQHPALFSVLLNRLQHMLKLGACVNVGGTVNNYSALQIAIYLNMEDVVGYIKMYSVTQPLWSCTTQPPFA